MSRRKRGSSRYKRARKRSACLKAKAARVRLHWQHETTTMVARRHNVAVLEALKTKNMMASASGTVEEPGKNVAQKRGLNRSIAGAAWFQFQTLLDYKLEERGGTLLLVNPAYTSQKCSACGATHKANRKNQAKFSCVECGHQDHADINAAINILAVGTRPATGDRRELKRAA